MMFPWLSNATTEKKLCNRYNHGDVLHLQNLYFVLAFKIQVADDCQLFIS
jgi:hypothetical protein